MENLKYIDPCAPINTSSKGKKSDKYNVSSKSKNTNTSTGNDDNNSNCVIYQSPIKLCTKDKQMFKSQSILTTPKTPISGYEYDQKLIQWNINTEDNKITIDNNNKTYQLIQFHTHFRAEHILNGKHYNLELHLVFISGDNIFVLALLVKLDNKTSKILRRIINNKPFKIPSIANYWAYPGSLTTPPFSKTVSWNVSNSILKVTPEDLEALKKLSKSERRIQDRDGRDIVYAKSCCKC